MPGKIIFAQATCVTADADGLEVFVAQGEPWDASDPVVKLHPGLFADTPPAPLYPRRTVPAVEQATAAPGEKRARRV